MSVAASCELLSSRVPDVCNHTSSSMLRSTSDTKSAAKHYQTMTELDKLENCINKLMDRSSAAGLTNKMPTDDDANDTVSLRKKRNSTEQLNDNAGKTPDYIGKDQNNENGNRLSISEEKITLTQSSNTQQLVRKNSLRMVTRSPVIRRRRTPISELDRTWADRKSTRLNSSHQIISYAVFCLKKKKQKKKQKKKKHNNQQTPKETDTTDPVPK